MTEEEGRMSQAEIARGSLTRAKDIDCPLKHYEAETLAGDIRHRGGHVSECTRVCGADARACR